MMPIVNIRKFLEALAKAKPTRFPKIRSNRCDRDAIGPFAAEIGRQPSVRIDTVFGRSTATNPV